MIKKLIFIIAHELGDYRFYPTYKKVVHSQWKSREEQIKEQEKQLRKMVQYAYEKVPYYHTLFKKNSIKPESINTIHDLEKIPPLTKQVIQEKWQEFIPADLKQQKYYNRSTGGSTGISLHYRLSKFDRFFSGAMLYRGWGYAGYNLGDRMVDFGGSSLDIGKTIFIVQKAHEFSRNMRKLSSFDMEEEQLYKYVQKINNFKPVLLRGYASSLYFFSQFIDETNLDIHSPNAVVTTSEKLYPAMRKKISSVFCCDVFDEYGMNDGGVSAHECNAHIGMHIDSERSIMEVVDKTNEQIKDGSGRIISTSLYNYALPFIRYETMDQGVITSEICSCGRESPILREIIGREQEILVTPEGKHIHGEFFTHIFWEIPHVKEFQVIQDSIDQITIEMVVDDIFDEKNLDMIRNYIRKRSERWIVNIRYVDRINRTQGGKYKFVINRVTKK